MKILTIVVLICVVPVCYAQELIIESREFTDADEKALVKGILKNHPLESGQNRQYAELLCRGESLSRVIPRGNRAYYGLKPGEGYKLDVDSIDAHIKDIALSPDSFDVRPLNIIKGGKSIQADLSAGLIHFTYSVYFSWNEVDQQGKILRKKSDTLQMETHHLVYPVPALKAIYKQLDIKEDSPIHINGDIYQLPQKPALVTRITLPKNDQHGIMVVKVADEHYKIGSVIAQMVGTGMAWDRKEINATDPKETEFGFDMMKEAETNEMGVGFSMEQVKGYKKEFEKNKVKGAYISTMGYCPLDEAAIIDWSALNTTKFRILKMLKIKRSDDDMVTFFKIENDVIVQAQLDAAIVKP